MIQVLHRIRDGADEIAVASDHDYEQFPHPFDIVDIVLSTKTGLLQIWDCALDGYWYELDRF